MQISSTRSQRPSARLKTFPARASTSSLTSAVAVVKRTRRRCSQAPMHSPEARCVLPRRAELAREQLVEIAEVAMALPGRHLRQALVLGGDRRRLQHAAVLADDRV